MTSVLNGNRFIYIEPLPEGKFLPRVSYCAGLRCNIYHWGQPKYKRKLLCKRCWGDDHTTSNCEDEEKCKVCKESGHSPGDVECKAYAKKQPAVVSCSGKDNPLSNFYPCDIKVFGETHPSSEHAFQHVKALRCGDLIAAEKSETHQLHLTPGVSDIASQQRIHGWTNGRQ